MRFAYADPPYPGCAHRYPENREVDHAALIAHLETYDAWALSTHSPGLHAILPMCPPDTRIMAWVKPFAVYKVNVNPAYAWEPVLVRGARKRARTERTVRDWVSAEITLRKGPVGAKPDAFWYWLFEMLGIEDSDSLDDLFPGTKGGARALAAYRNRPRQTLLTTSA